LIVVFDSNVWISALEFGGAPLKAIDLATGRMRIALCAPILAEIRSILKAKFNWLDESINGALDEYALETLMVPVRNTLRGVCRDPNDDVVLECAVRAGADVIVSGDKDLLALKTHKGIRVVTPREFLDELKSKADS
jgi:uncharacterized protein